MSGNRHFRTAVDIGGTFTDLVAMEEGSGRIHVSKADTTPSDFTSGVMDTLDRSEIDAPGISFFIHGSTIVINTLTERKGAKTGLITTRGFRDVLEIGRANRPDLYNMYYRKPPPFVPRRFRAEITERVGPKGNILVPLAEEEVKQLAGFFRSGWEEALSMLWMWVLVNGTLSAAGALIALAHPLTIVLSFVAAPITSMNPTIGVGIVTGLIESFLRKPQVKDFENIYEDIKSFKGFYRNRLTHILLVFLFSTIGSAIGTFIGIPYLSALLAK